MRKLLIIILLAVFCFCCNTSKLTLNKKVKDFSSVGIQDCFKIRADEVSKLNDTTLTFSGSYPVVLEVFEINSSFVYESDPFMNSSQKLKKCTNVLDTIYYTSNLSEREYTHFLGLVMKEMYKANNYGNTHITSLLSGLMFLNDEVVIAIMTEKYSIYIYRKNMICVKSLYTFGVNCQRAFRGEWLVIENQEKKIQISLYKNTDERILPIQAIEWYEEKYPEKSQH